MSRIFHPDRGAVRRTLAQPVETDDHGGAPIAVDTSAKPSADTAASLDPTITSGRRPRRWGTAAAVAIGLTIGVVAALIGARVVGGEDTAVENNARIAPGEINGPEDLLPAVVEVPPGAGATSPHAAVTGFLDAELAGDFDRSFGFLSAVERAEYGSPGGWISAHADVVPPVLDYELGEQVVVADGRRSIATRVEFEPGLDRVVGLTPATATVRWDVVEDEDGWGVSLQTSPVEPVYPSDDGVEAAADAWVTARQRCRTSDNERPGLVGSAGLAELLCDAEAVEVGTPAPLDEISGQAVFTAFGPEAVSAARVVRASDDVDLGIVLVPVGAQWIVIGILP